MRGPPLPGVSSGRGGFFIRFHYICRMIKFEQALKIVLDAAEDMADRSELLCEEVSLKDACGRVLCQVVVSERDMPPFNKSAVDGYACRYADLENRGAMSLLEVIPAGKSPEFKVVDGYCSKIMTGAMVPEGAESILMVEDALVEGGEIRPAPDYKFSRNKTNICLQGEDILLGTTVLQPGTLLKPQHIATLAAMGCADVCVASKPKVAIISTGDELVDLSVEPNSVQIRDSNGWQLLAQASRAGANPSYLGIVKDQCEVLKSLLERALAENTLIILTGGVSMGDFDMVPDVLRSLGVEILFDRVAVQPGKPTTFGVVEYEGASRFIFGLPGNPVSSFIQFELMVRPLLMKLMGSIHQSVTINMPISHEYRRKRSERMAHVPMEIDESGRCKMLHYNGSGHIEALNSAWGVARIPLGVSQLQENDMVEVILL